MTTFPSITGNRLIRALRKFGFEWYVRKAAIISFNLYWDIGRKIVEKRKMLGWGERVIDCVSAGLRNAFPATTGFSPRSLRSMKHAYLSYFDPTIWLHVVAKLTDRKNIETISSTIKR